VTPAGYSDTARHLTPRMRAVLDQAASGLTVNQAAAVLGVTPSTVRTIRAAACSRLNARNVVEAVAIAERAGILH
jgi:DNA-binding NarL/FixJ family response regulator